MNDKADTTLLTDDLEYWRLFFLRARRTARGGVQARVHIEHLTAAAVCIGNAIKALQVAAGTSRSPRRGHA